MYKLINVMEANGVQSTHTNFFTKWTNELRKSDKSKSLQDEVDRLKYDIFASSDRLKLHNVVRFAQNHQLRGEDLKTLRALRKYIAFSYLNKGEFGMLIFYTQHNHLIITTEEKESYLKAFRIQREYEIKELFNKDAAYEFIFNHVGESFNERIHLLNEKINIGRLEAEIERAIKEDLENARNK